MDAATHLDSHTNSIGTGTNHLPNGISEFGTITMKMISSAINNGREQTKIGSINIRVVPPAPQRFFCQRPMVMSVTVGRLKWQADEVPV